MTKKTPEELAIEQFFSAHKQVVNATSDEMLNQAEELQIHKDAERFAKEEAEKNDEKFAEEAEKDKWDVWEMTR